MLCFQFLEAIVINFMHDNIYKINLINGTKTNYILFRESNYLMIH